MNSLQLLSQTSAIDVLLELYENPGLMQSQIADKTKPHSGTRRKCLADLENAGWIESKKSPQHWSAICYFVTAEGERVCKLLLQIRDGDEHRTSVVHGTHQEDVSVTEKK